jgi:histidyl-tRNA synthetase
VRGFDYYTRTVFEFASSVLGAQSAICGGGRYDGLVHSLGGPPTPAVGFGLGIERFLMVVDALGLEAEHERSGIAAIALGENARTHLLALVAELRRTADVTVSFDYNDAKLATHLKRADRVGARAAIIVGDDELAQRALVLRDLQQRAQQTLVEGADLPETARAILAWYAETIATPALHEVAG